MGNTRIRLLVICVIAHVGHAQSVRAAQSVQGVVYDDQNGNQARDPGEAGIPQVKVTNGLDVVLTDAQGRYTLPVTDDTIVSVIKPRNWRTAFDALHLPRFYHIHKPKGSPDNEFIYKGVAPTGSLPESVDFGLRKSPEPDQFDVVLIGDPQPYDLEDLEDYAQDVIAEIAAEQQNAAFVIALGDLVGDDLALFDPLNQVQALVGLPFYNVYGNHDMNFLSPNDKYADETFERVYGPADYAFQYGPVHFIVLDNVYWKGFEGLRDNGKPKNGNYEGRLRSDQLTFIENYLRHVSRKERIVICTHIPMINPENVQHSTPQLDQLLRMLSPFPHTLSFSGHTHVNGNYLAGADSGYTPKAGTKHHHHNVGTGSGCWYRGPLDARGFPIRTMADGTPPGYAIATFRGPEYRVRWKCAGHPEDYQMRISVGREEKDPTTRVVVNVFNGSPESKVRMQIRKPGQPNANWMSLSRSPGKDPTLVARFDEWKKAADAQQRTPLPSPADTEHLWSALLPPLAPGRYLLAVETQDRHGQTWQATHVFKIADSSAAGR